MEEELTIPHTCEECQHSVQDGDHYCYNCGAHLNEQVVTVNIFNNFSLRQVFLFYFIYLFICLLVKHTRWFDSYDRLFWIEIALAAVTLHFAWRNRKSLFPILRFNNFKWQVFLGVIIFAAAASCIVNVTMRQVNVSFFGADVNYFNAYKLYFFPVATMIYSIAVIPAIFEEVAFRGIMYNYCENFLDERLVVAVTAFLFAIMHLSLLSLVWLVPFGFFIGHLRRRYNTLWYGIFFHFAFNLTAVVIDLYKGGQL
ncbi:CPBP family intramembrane glutamic endopeptidase [Aridibaculum aurantiacum]|uniref:CPBP family intramembrane glutamic endopeptidase n=1 Tax=Aridibaculum aurantiacum TaxID=2810307 RepID=UPI001A968164|nr:CPBP family intramembrane glutamic endopeptidase [Aridibaculum aurantiacum]